MVHPDRRAVIPLMPEAIVQHDGTAKNDGARNAAKRFGAKRRQDHPHLQFIITEDSLRAHAPHIEALPAHGLPYIRGVQEGAHAFWFQQGQAAADAGRVTYDERPDRAAGLGHRFRLVQQGPLTASNAAMHVNGIEYWARGADRGQHLSWITDLRGHKRHGYALMQGGRARGKIDNETFNTRKNPGDNCEPNDGHGMKNLAVVFATVMLLAFVVDQPPQWCCALVQAVWAKLGSKRLWWERRRALFYPYQCDSMRVLCAALLYGLEKSRPILSLDAS